MNTIDPVTQQLQAVSVQQYLAERRLVSAAEHARAMKKMFKGIVGSKTRDQYAAQVIGDRKLMGR